MFSLFRSEVFRLRKRPQSWLLVVIAFVLTGMFYAGFALGSRVVSGTERQDLVSVLPFSELPEFGLSLGLGFIGSVMLVIVASGMMGNEYAWNTLRPLVARARSRRALLTAKLLALLVYTAAFSVVLAVLIAGLSIAGSAIAGVDAGVSASAAVDAAWFTLRAIVANVPYLALAFLLATLARSNTAGIAGALGVMFLEGIVLSVVRAFSGYAQTLQEWGISWNVQEVMVGWDGDAGNWRSIVVLAAYTAAFVTLSYVVFLRRDVTSG